MKLALVDTCSDRGSGWPNEDGLFVDPRRAAIFDGATSIGRARLVDDESDARWLVAAAIDSLGAAPLGGDAPETLDHIVRTVAATFQRDLRRAPETRREVPAAAAILAQLDGAMLECRWFGDCAAYVWHPGADQPTIIGDAAAQAAEEAARIRVLQDGEDGAIRWTEERILAVLNARDAVNTVDGKWLFTPDPTCLVGVRSEQIAVVKGTRILLATDGFHALSNRYALLDPSDMIDAATHQGLDTMVNLLRAYEATDPTKTRHPRFKLGDDATAMLIEVTN